MIITASCRLQTCKHVHLLSALINKVTLAIATRNVHCIWGHIDFIDEVFPLTLFQTSIKLAPLPANRSTSQQRRLLQNISCAQNMAKFNPVTHVIFDMDGLILDTEKIYLKVLTGIAEKFNKVYTQEVRMKVLGTMEQDTARIMVRELQLPIKPEEFTALQKQAQELVLGEAEVMPGADRLIRHLHKHGVPIAVATSSGADSVAIKTARHKELFSLFSHVVMANSDAEVKNGKPSPDIFLVCATRFPNNPKPKECLVFEDAPNGVTAGIAAGMQTVMVPDPATTTDKRKHATLVLDSLEDFKPELFGLPAF